MFLSYEQCEYIEGLSDISLLTSSDQSYVRRKESIMADRKRERDESALDAALQSLEASVSKEVADKTKALKDLRELIDEDDESYETQKQAAAGGVLNTLMQLLEDDSEAVAAEAALALTALCANSKAAQTRLDLTKTTATATVDKVRANPVQHYLYARVS